MMNQQAKSKNLLVVGGASGMGMWLVLHVFGRAQDIGRITLADVHPLESDSGARTNPESRYRAELASLEIPMDAVRLNYDIPADGLFAEWTPVKTSGINPRERLRLQDYDVVM